MFELVFAALALAFAAMVITSLVKRARGYKPPAPDPNRLSVGVGHTVTMGDVWIEWAHVYGQGFKVPISAVQAITVEKAGFGKATLKVVGSGTELAKVADLPLPWAENAQNWITERLARHAKGAAQ